MLVVATTGAAKVDSSDSDCYLSIIPEIAIFIRENDDNGHQVEVEDTRPLWV